MEFNIGFGDAGDPADKTTIPEGVNDGNPGFGDFEIVFLGFGDFDPPPLMTPVMVGTPEGYALFHDEGGEIVRILGNFGLDNPALALDNHTTYRVRLKGPDGLETYYPSSGSCYSATAGNGEVISPSAASTILKFALPPMPLGTYIVVVYKSDDLVTAIWEIDEMILIERRKRDAATYRTRNRLHQLYLTGPRRERQEPEYPNPQAG